MNVDVATGQVNWLNATQIAQDVDETCDRFEAAWRTGDRPRIEDFLGGAPHFSRRVVLRHLLAVEFDYRGRLGEFPEPLEYRCRFPGQDGLIDSVLAHFTERFKEVRPADLDTFEIRTGPDGTRSGAARVRGRTTSRVFQATRSRRSWAGAGWVSCTRPARSGSTAFAL